jgi:hypothetical protein
MSALGHKRTRNSRLVAPKLSVTKLTARHRRCRNVVDSGQSISAFLGLDVAVPKKEVSSAVVYNGDTDGYRPWLGCNVWRCRCPDKRNVSREISQRNLSCHDNSLYRLLPPSPLLSSSLSTLLLRLRLWLRLPIRVLLLRLPIPTLLRLFVPTLVVVTQNKSAGQKGGRFCTDGRR